MSRVCYECFRNISEGDMVCPYCGFRIGEHNLSERVLAPGTVLNGKYIIGRTLGEGGFGITYLAWDKNMEVRIAVKEYYPGNLVVRDTTLYGGNTLHTVTSGGKDDFTEGLHRFVKEAAILSKFFNLPGIVSVKDFFYENGTAYMAMEYVDGISLKDYLKENGNVLSVKETLAIVKPIISSLAVIHQSKLLHRDISPDNIMISRKGEVKLIDFGAARYFDSDYDKSMTVVLKHGYAPIEQYSRKSLQGEATDIYSLCAVMYRMLTGIIPDEAIERVREDKLVTVKKYNKKIPKYIAEIIQKGLSVDAKDRQQSMTELYQELYATKKQLWEKTGDRIYLIIRKCMIFIAIILLLTIMGSVLFILNRRQINDFSDKVKKVFSEQEYSVLENTSEENMQLKSTEKKEEIQEEKGEEANVTIEETEADSEEKIQAGDMLEEADTQVDVDKLQTPDEITETDSELKYEIMVVSQGNLNGISEDYTVGDILTEYSDNIGNWTGRRDENGNVYVTFLGTKQGSPFTLEFQVFDDDTFTLIGATQAGVECEKYASFFQSILDEQGF